MNENPDKQQDTALTTPPDSALLDALATIYRAHVARAAAEHEAHLLGLMTRDEHDHSEVLLRGMWHMFAEAVLHAPITTKEMGQRLLAVDDRIPDRYRTLRIDPGPETPDTTGWNDTAIEIAHEIADLMHLVRVVDAFQHARAHVLAIDERTRNNWQFATQLLGFDPSDHPTRDTH
ncbi:hypothetical protein VMT65_31210 [Nocardia sp. CDC153]|uniref:hypothetical protein n=1 Tax=Nocardia sp. CDC153 TaxID=3112167 RepID=UPI002DBEA1B4|nr:hypothetical protein [Nocardia sp. CDC153]MEC3957539.1 hypothetical protein [Nocardia sp. CDC153]